MPALAMGRRWKRRNLWRYSSFMVENDPPAPIPDFAFVEISHGEVNGQSIIRKHCALK